NGRRKVINAGARHDDAVPAPMSFLSDTQEFTAVVLPELDIEMLALNLQFSRFDDVVHFALRARVYGFGGENGRKFHRLFFPIFGDETGPFFPYGVTNSTCALRAIFSPAPLRDRRI